MPNDFYCDDEFKTQVQERLAAFSRESLEPTGTAAAVTLPIIESGFGADLSGMPVHPQWQSLAALLLTKRSSKLRDHPGQWALPGGRVDPGETPEQTALREMHEEVGLDLPEAAVLGRLDDFKTRSGFMITPVVVWIGRGVVPVPNPDEVDTIHRIPVSEFLRHDAPLLNHEEGEGVDGEPVLRMPVGDSWIAAPTAAFLYQFSQVCLLGREMRVAHYDQPKFAWR